MTRQIQKSSLIKEWKCMSLLKTVKKKAGFTWSPQPLRHSVQRVKDKSGLYLQVYIPSWSGKVFKVTVFRLLENGFAKLPRPWSDLIINPLCRTNPHKFLRKSLFPHLPWKVLLRKRSSRMEFCFGEFWQFNAFVMLKTSFSKHQVNKINMTCVCIKPEGKKKMSSQTDRSKVLDLRGKPPSPLSIPSLTPLVGNPDVLLRKTLRSVTYMFTAMTLKRVSESVFLQSNTFRACKVKDGKEVAESLTVFNLLKIIHIFHGNKHLRT